MPMDQTLHIHFDGGSRGNPGPAGIGIVIGAPDGTPLLTLGRYIGTATNNVAEYTALITAFQEAGKLADVSCIGDDGKRRQTFLDLEIVDEGGEFTRDRLAGGHAASMRVIGHGPVDPYGSSSPLAPSPPAAVPPRRARLAESPRA